MLVGWWFLRFLASCSGLLGSFVDLMHDVVKEALAEGADEGIIAEAVQRKSGWLHIQGALETGILSF